MEKIRLVRDIQTALKNAGYRVSQKTISGAFSSDRRGKYCRALYGVWQNCSVGGIVTALKNRGVIELPGKKLVSPSKQKKGGQKESIIEDDRDCVCPYCGYPDPGWPQATHCPNCEEEVMPLEEVLL